MIAANAFDGVLVNADSFAYRDLTQQDRWIEFTPTFTSLTVVGATTYKGRFRIVGKQCHFQISMVAATSIESTAGTTYVTLPVTANPGGLAGIASMSNASSNIAVGLCHINISNSLCYLPTHPASNSTFTISGHYEV